MFYPAKLTKENDGGYTVTFRDIPEAITYGDDLQEELNMAKDALITSMFFYFDDHRKVPLPSADKEDEYLIDLPASVFAKVLLLNEMINEHISNVELAKRINVKPQEMQRILNLNHTTKIDTISNAISALGKKLELRIA